jgi:adapter protein MecA 1/2
MRIERVDDKTIKCFLSLQELEEYNVDYRDFLSRNDKAQKLMREIIDQAREEVGYRPPKLAFEMQIMMVPEQGMVLTFSEKEPIDLDDDRKVDGFIQNLKDLIEHIKEYRGQSEKAGAAGLIPEIRSENLPKDGSGEGGESAKDPIQVNEAVFAFGSISKVMQYAEGIPSNLRVTSRLYKMEDYYYLYMTKGTASYDKFSRACVQALEFAALYRADVGCDTVLKEHGELLIAEKALRKLGTGK